MTKTNTNKNIIERNDFYYIIYKYNEDKNDIEYFSSKLNIIDAINTINDLLQIDYNNRLDTKDFNRTYYIKDVEKAIKQRNISKYITTSIDNLKIINKYIIFKQFINEENTQKNILSQLEKQALTNDKILINRINKTEIIKYQFNAKKRIIKSKKWNDKNYTLDKKDAFKKAMEIKLKITNNFNKIHDNKNILQGGVLYE